MSLLQAIKGQPGVTTSYDPSSKLEIVSIPIAVAITMKLIIPQSSLLIHGVIKLPHHVAATISCNYLPSTTILHASAEVAHAHPGSRKGQRDAQLQESVRRKILNPTPNEYY